MAKQIEALPRWLPFLSWRCFILLIAVTISGQGAVDTVCSSGCTFSDVQSAFSGASCGDEIDIAPGTWIGQSYVTTNCLGNPITVTSMQKSFLPASNARVTPSYAALMPILTSSAGSATGPVTFCVPAAGWHFVGVGFTSLGNIAYYDRGFVYEIVDMTCGSSPARVESAIEDDIVFDRIYLFSPPNDSIETPIGLDIQGKALTIKNSYFGDNFNSGGEGKSIGGSNVVGPLTIYNNYLQGSTENFLIAGSAVDWWANSCYVTCFSGSYTDGNVPVGVTIEYNYMNKPFKWWQDPVNNPYFTDVLQNWGPLTSGNWMGQWSPGTYQINDAVDYCGIAYIATAITSATPPGTGWSVISYPNVWKGSSIVNWRGAWSSGTAYAKNDGVFYYNTSVGIYSAAIATESTKGNDPSGGSPWASMPQVNGTHPCIKNLGEIKNGKNITWRFNVAENAWNYYPCEGQPGFGFGISPRAYSGSTNLYPAHAAIVDGTHMTVPIADFGGLPITITAISGSTATFSGSNTPGTNTTLFLGGTFYGIAGASGSTLTLSGSPSGVSLPASTYYVPTFLAINETWCPSIGPPLPGGPGTSPGATFDCRQATGYSLSGSNISITVSATPSAWTNTGKTGIAYLWQWDGAECLSGITISNNWIRNASVVMQFIQQDSGIPIGAAGTSGCQVTTQNAVVQNNLITNTYPQSGPLDGFKFRGPGDWSYANYSTQNGGGYLLDHNTWGVLDAVTAVRTSSACSHWGSYISQYGGQLLQGATYSNTICPQTSNQTRDESSQGNGIGAAMHYNADSTTKALNNWIPGEYNFTCTAPQVCAGNLNTNVGQDAQFVSAATGIYKVASDSLLARAASDGLDIGANVDQIPQIQNLKVSVSDQTAILDFDLSAPIRDAGNTQPCVLEVSSTTVPLLENGVTINRNALISDLTAYTVINDLNPAYFINADESNSARTNLLPVIVGGNHVTWPIGQKTLAKGTVDGLSHNLALSSSTNYGGRLMCYGDTQTFEFATLGRISNLSPSNVSVKVQSPPNTLTARISYGPTAVLGSSIDMQPDNSGNVEFQLPVTPGVSTYYQISFIGATTTTLPMAVM